MFIFGHAWFLCQNYCKPTSIHFIASSLVFEGPNQLRSLTNHFELWFVFVSMAVGHWRRHDEPKRSQEDGPHTSYANVNYTHICIIIHAVFTIHVYLNACKLYNCTLYICTLYNCTLYNCTLYNCTLYNCTHRVYYTTMLLASICLELL